MARIGLTDDMIQDKINFKRSDTEGKIRVAEAKHV